MFEKKKIGAKIPLRTGVRKGIALLTIIVMLGALFSISVSAIEPTGSNTQGDFTIVGISDPNTNYISSVVAEKVSSSRTRLRVTFSSAPAVDTEIVFVLQFQLPDSMIGCTDGAYLGSFKIMPDVNFSICPESENSFSRMFNLEKADNFSFMDSLEGNDVITVKYSTQSQLEVHTVYLNKFTVKVNKSSTSYNVYVDGLDSFNFVDWSVYSSNSVIDNQNENTDKITQNQDENTDKIIDNQNQLQENEKNEAENAGNSGVDDLTGAIPDYSQEFESIFDLYFTTLCHNKVISTFTFPGISTPKIGNIIPAYELLKPQIFDLNKVIKSVSNSITTLVRLMQAVLGISLILYCVKETYDIIAYIFTLGKGLSKNE